MGSFIHRLFAQTLRALFGWAIWGVLVLYPLTALLISYSFGW